MALAVAPAALSPENVVFVHPDEASRSTSCTRNLDGQEAESVMPKMIRLDSSSIDRAGYDDGAHELHLRYRHGATYVYRAVPRQRFAELLAAASKGTYVNRHIKPHYDYRKLDRS